MQTAGKKLINGWAMYDWANSVYNLVITTTFFPAYYAAVTSKEKFPEGIYFLGRHFVNTELKDYVLAFGFLIIACLSPVLSSIADYKGNKKNFMRFFCYMGATACCLMFFFDDNHVTLGLMCFMFAGIGFYGSQVFYNSYLPEIAAEEDMDRVSAKGYALGYIGSVLMQMIGFGLVIVMPGSALPLQITFLLVGVWWVGFAQITFNVLPVSSKKEREQKINVLTNGFKELKIVLNQLQHLPVLKRFLAAFFFYSMGVQTVMLVAIDFGIKELKLPNEQLIITAVIIQLVAIAGAYGMSALSARYGNIKILSLTVLLWIGICIGGYFITTQTDFYIIASLVGLVMGGIQSLSRSSYSKFMPETKDTASFFSFYDVTEKLAIVIGLFTFGFIEGRSSIRQSILSLIVFFAAGFIFLLFTAVKQKNYPDSLMKLYSINTGYFKLDGGAMFGVVPKSIWNKLNPADENNMCSWALRCLLIEDAGKLILIDTGMGNKQDAKFFGHYYLHGDDTLDKSLLQHGFTREDITDVFLTHLHFDHCGGCIVKENAKLIPAFKNAAYWSNERHWQWATQPNEREKASFLKENILPIQESGQLKFITSERPAGNVQKEMNNAEPSTIKEEWSIVNQFNIFPSQISDYLSLLFVNGHTDAMMLPIIKYKEKTIAYVADLLPSAAHIPLPYVMGYDMFPLTTLKEKKNFLTEALENDYVLFFEHDAKNECCSLQQTEKGIREKDSFRLNEI